MSKGGKKSPLFNMNIETKAHTFVIIDDETLKLLNDGYNIRLANLKIWLIREEKNV